MKSISAFINEAKSPDLITTICKAIGLNKDDDKVMLDEFQKIFTDNNITSIETFVVTKAMVDDMYGMPKSVLNKYYTVDDNRYKQLLNDNDFKEVYKEDGTFGFTISISKDKVLSCGFEESDHVFIICK